MPDAPDLSVVILNYNAAEHVRRCLRSLPDGCAGLTYEVIVVDNASPQQGIEAVVRAFPGARLIRRRRNGGFSAGTNVGIRASRAAAVLLLNPDTALTPGAAATLLAYARADADVGIVGPRILNTDGSLQLSCRRFPDFSVALFNRNSWLTRLLPRNRFSARYLMTDVEHDAVRDVDWLSGAAMLLDRRALECAGLFDERYFFSIEDVDLCRRMHDAGFRVVYLSDATVTHEIGASSRTAPNRVILARHRGMWLYYRSYLRRGVLMDAAVGAVILGRCLASLAGANLKRIGAGAASSGPIRATR